MSKEAVSLNSNSNTRNSIRNCLYLDLDGGVGLHLPQQLAESRLGGRRIEAALVQAKLEAVPSVGTVTTGRFTRRDAQLLHRIAPHTLHFHAGAFLVALMAQLTAIVLYQLQVATDQVQNEFLLMLVKLLIVRHLVVRGKRKS